MIDPEKIFNLFSRADDNPSSKEKDDITDQLISVVDTPSFKLGIFKKLIMNHTNFSDGLLKLLKRTDSDFDIDDVKNAGECLIYTRAWQYIKDFDVKDVDSFEAIKKFSSQELLTTIHLSINYFQEVEEYKKCAHLHKIAKAVQFFTT